LRKLSTAMALVALSMAIGVTSVRASPETPQLGTTTITPLLSSILNNVNTIGDDAFSTVDTSTLSPPPTQHYGPYLSSSPDSGSCGNNWATDTFDRHFSVFSQNGALVVVEQFKNFSFVTQAGMSPGACDNGQLYDGGVVDSGITGSAVGYFIVPIPSGIMQTSSSSFCDAALFTDSGCTTATFINTHFADCAYPTVCSVTTFFDHYAAGDQGLIANSWVDSSSDRAGEIGDIRSA
jgi:hypothetical protein